MNFKNGHLKSPTRPSPTYINFNNFDFNSYFYMFLDFNSFYLKRDRLMHSDFRFMLQTGNRWISLLPDLTHRDADSFADFDHLRQSTVISFFVDNMVDVPVCFKKSKSLYSVAFELKTLRCINFLTRHGRREQMFKFFNTSLNHVINLNKTALFPQAGTNTWLFLYKILSNSVMANQKSTVLTTNPSGFNWRPAPSTTQTFLFQRNFYYDQNMYFNPLYFTKTIFFNLVKRYSPLFTFYVRKVDKKIRKHSRGKSGKYLIVWKYIPEYKRFYLALRWFLKDLKFYREKTFTERLTRALHTLLTTPEQTFLAKLRKFSHLFVFQNFKKTLLKTLRATS